MSKRKAEHTQPICRFCLETSTLEMANIFSTSPTTDIPTAEEIWIMLGIKVEPEDGLPKGICITCLTKVNYVKRIRKQFLEADTTLRELHQNGLLTYNVVLSPECTDDEPAKQYHSTQQAAASASDLSKSYEQSHEPQTTSYHYQNDQLLTEDQIIIVKHEEVVDDDTTTVVKVESAYDIDNASEEPDKAGYPLYTESFIEKPSIVGDPVERPSKSFNTKRRLRKHGTSHRFRFGSND
ncbi:uncharacterized protein LOC129723665 [Wyeomyia smithii]|uniref:uncharacterized protein LOC129723665 n=1 Tax=Wyeomyia smithii TaxID=174621 RepID=UPI002467B00F|nr:uncharacterized protein LOC129723665 [Wyeomyia smithii]XP_055533993.1 uncharacterized protein LOC129723665 [Wyeomyia smithii]